MISNRSSSLVIHEGPAHGAGLKMGPYMRRLPRIRLGKRGIYWRATWVAQNDSMLYEEARSRIKAIRLVIGFARYQRWPLFVRRDV